MVRPVVPAKPEDAWRPARLIPTTGIGGQAEQEQRATSSLLAVMFAVPQFGRALLDLVGAPAGSLQTFTEVRFEDDDQKLAVPDGAWVVERGKTRWVGLLEVKTAGAPLREEQVSRYIELANRRKFDTVITISNQITTAPDESPITVDKRRLKGISLRHLSWWQIMTEARVEHRYRGISDPDQQWILGELIAYLDHEKAGAGGFDDMGDNWVAVREGARQGTLRITDAGVRDVAARWEQFVQYVALGLCQDLGRRVTPTWPKKLDQAARLELLTRSLVERGVLSASIQVPDAVAPIELQADLGKRTFTTAVEILAPREGYPKTRINWMTRQLAGAPDDLMLEVRYPNVRDTLTATLKDARAKPERLLYVPDRRRGARAFRLSLAKDLGAKRGRGQGSFVRESRQQSVDFYRAVVQHLRPWSAGAPKLPESTGPASSDASPVPPDFSAPEGRAFGEATEPEA
jgi:hypothetical protein